MNPLHLTARNLRTFENLDLDLPAGCVVIGGANGAGKSTILNAIDVALFAARGELPQLLTLGEQELYLELQFEHAGELYRVRRTFKGRKTTLDLEKNVIRDFAEEWPNDPSSWSPLTRETAEQTQKHLEEILGLSRATFRASSFLAQGDGAAFTEASPRDRKAILAEILGLGVYEKLQEQARGELRSAQDGLVELGAKTEQLEAVASLGPAIASELSATRPLLADAQERHAVKTAELERAQLALAGNEAALERVRTAEAELAAAREQAVQAGRAHLAAVSAGAECETVQAELDQATAIAATVPALEAELAASEDAMRLAVRRQELRDQAKQRDETNARRAREKTQLLEHAAALEGKAAHLEGHISESASCDRCGQNLGAEAAARAAASYRADADTARGGAAERTAEVEAEYAAIGQLVDQADAIHYDHAARAPDVVEAQLSASRSASTIAAALGEKLRQLAELATTSDALAVDLGRTADAVTAAEEALGTARAGVGDEHELALAVGSCRQLLGELAELVDTHKRTIARLEVQARQVFEAQTTLAGFAAEVETISKRIDVLKLADRAFGRDGIPALIVENAAIPQLELEANRILGELGGATADCRIELRTQRELKTSAELRETLDIVIVTGAGERAYETFSGGERTRLNLSLRIALARLLAHRRGAESRLLAIDEPEFLDEAGVGRLADVLRGLSGDFDRVLLVSHHPTLAAAFDLAIGVVKDGDRSRVDLSVDAAGTPLEVAA